MREGWTWLQNSRKDHYFVEGKSLCGKWMLASDFGLKEGDGDPDYNCATCRKKLGRKKLVKRKGKTGGSK